MWRMLSWFGESPSFGSRGWGLAGVRHFDHGCNGSEVVASCHGRKDGAFNFMPPVNHLVVAEPEYDEVDGTESRIAASIKLEANWVDVICSTIHFNNEPPADQEVDAFPIDPNLPRQRQFVLGKSDVGYGLGATLTDSVSEEQDGQGFRYSASESLPFREGHQWRRTSSERT